MGFSFLLSFIFAFVQVIVGAEYPAPPATFPAKSWTVWGIEIKGSRRAEIDVQFAAADGSADFIKMIRLDLVGTPAERGFAHGALLANEIKKFVNHDIDKVIIQEVMAMSFDKVKTLPVEIQEVLAEMKKVGSAFAPKLFKKAMYWVWQKQLSHTPQYIKDEIDGVAQGVCSTIGDSCDVAETTIELQSINMFPELIKMACTAVGAWGKATTNPDTLIQLRALDFGSGPWASNHIIQVHRGDPANPDHAFVNVAFPGMVGTITGVAQNGVGISQKVWMTNYQSIPGTYAGEADVFVLRDMLSYAKTKEEAEAMAQKATRTWAIWIGLGDFSSKRLNLLGYQQNSAGVFDDKTIDSMNGQPYMESIAYVDKHPQPSWEGVNGTLPTALADFYGKIDQHTMKQIVQFHQTGDVHWASYDFGANAMQLAIGRTNSDGYYGPEEGATDSHVWMAFNRPSVTFDLSDLWEGK